MWIPPLPESSNIAVYFIHLWAMGNSTLSFIVMLLVPFLTVLIPLTLGERYGRAHTRKNSQLNSVLVESSVTAAFGLLAFMLAFTFQIAATRYDKRKELLVKEVDNIRTAYLRAGLIHEPIKSDTRRRMVDYVDLLVRVTKGDSKIEEAKATVQRILDSCWRDAEALAREDRSSEVYSLFTGTINDLYSSYNERVAIVLEYKIPWVVYFVLGTISVLSMLVLGYQFGISGRGSMQINIMLSLIFAIVMLLIIILDYPETGLLQVNQQPLMRLQEDLSNFGR